jgi:anaerobic magnesium-protoporphyrin IX monomethyl ester cyclase
MRVVFLEPPAVTERTPERFAGCTYELYHFADLGNLYPFTILHNEGVDVDYLDAGIDKDSEEAFLQKILAKPADYYVIHAVVLAKPTDHYWMKKIRQHQPDAFFLLHGPEATRVPEEYLGSDTRKIVFRGEVERTLVDFIMDRDEGDHWGQARYMPEEKSVKVFPPDPRGYVRFDDLPIPARDHAALLPYKDFYFNPKYRGRPHAVMLASRGCSFRCSFCVPNAISFQRELVHQELNDGRKPPVKKASAQRVYEEMKWLKDNGYKSVHISDDQFLWAKKRTLEICRLIEPLQMEWGMLSRADFLTDEKIVEALAKAGCASIDIGVESLQQKVLDAINKDLDVEDVYTAIDLCNKHGISPKLNIMFGTTPQETPEDIHWTIKKLKELKVTNVMFSIATPFKGTPFFDFCKEKGYLIDESDNLNPMGKAMISYPQLSNQQLEELERLAYRSFYIRPRIVLDRLKRMRRPKDLLTDLRVARQVLLH